MRCNSLFRIFFVIFLVFHVFTFLAGCSGKVGGDEDGDVETDLEVDGTVDGEDVPGDGDAPMDPDIETDGDADLDIAEDEGGGGSNCLERGIPDDDEDNISNDMEGGGAVDTDFDGIPDSMDTDSDNDTIPDVDEAGRSDCTLPPEDFDEDGLANFRDIDSDGDFIKDEDEGSGDVDRDGLPNYLDLDSDSDGMDDIDEGGDMALTSPPVDSDGDTVADFIDLDSDNDSLYDWEEEEVGINPLDQDSDGDTISDYNELLLGYDPADNESYPSVEMMIELPYLAGSTVLDIDVDTGISKADVYFFIDSTGSMTEELDIVAGTIFSTIIPHLQAVFPDLQTGTGEFKDECDEDTFPLRNRANLTGDATAVESALRGMSSDGGCGYSAFMEGLYWLAVGGSETWTASGSGCGSGHTLPVNACGPGQWGYPCFRNDAFPFVVIITDVETRCDMCLYDYDCVFSPLVHIYAEVVGALVGRGVKIVGINSGGFGPGADAGPDLRMLAWDTGSVDASGVEVVYDIPSDGTGLETAVTEGIEKLSFERFIDVGTAAVEFPFIDDGIDATNFIKRLTPTGFVLPSPDTPPPTFDADGFYGVTPGTILSYEVELSNDFVPEGDRPQVFLVELRAADGGGNFAGSIRILITVPPEDLEIIGGEVVQCMDGSECDDFIPCTVDTCTEHFRCRHEPDDAGVCDDGNPCNGLEKCRPDMGYGDHNGCIGGISVVCNMDDSCIVGQCSALDGECVYSIVDGDEDGYGAMGCRLCDGSGSCIEGDDCDDGEWAVNPGADEICHDGIDNDCNGRADLLDETCNATNDTCSSPTVLSGEGTYIGSLRGTADDYVTMCGDPLLLDAVFSITLMEGHDVGLRVMGSFNAIISVQTVCGNEASELYCGMNSLLARGLHAGTYTIIVEGGEPDSFRMSVEIAPYTEVYHVPPTNDDCTSPYILPPEGGLFVGTTVGMLNDFEGSCVSSGSPDAVFELTLAASKVVDVYTTTNYDGVLHMHNAPCVGGTEVACNDDSGGTRHSHINVTVGPGTFYIIVDGYSSFAEGNYEMNVVITDP